jgi:DNA invertase Pin-like site-specific DNA recombinase
MTSRPPAFPYLRWSSEQQAEGDSRRRQIAGAQRFALDFDLELQDTLIDSGVSAGRGGNLKVGALATFIADAKSGKLPPRSWLLIEAFDRFSRAEALIAIQHFISLLTAGVTIGITGDQTIIRPTANYIELLTPLIKLGGAHADNQARTERTRASWRQRMADVGPEEPLTARCPGWLRVVDAVRANGRVRGGHYDVVAGRDEVVRGIFRDCAAGIGAETIARRLNEQGVEPFSTGSGWHKSYIVKLFNNPAVIGDYVPHTRANGLKRHSLGGVVKNVYPKIVDEVLFFRAQTARKARQQTGGRNGPGFRNILRGLCKCVECRGPMIMISKGQAPKGGDYWLCDNWNRRRACKNSIRLRAEPFERLLLDLLSPVLLGVEDLPIDAATGALAIAVAALDVEISRQGLSVGRLLDAFAEATDAETIENITKRKAALSKLRLDRKAAGDALAEAQARLPAAEELAMIQALRVDAASECADVRYAARARIAEALRSVVSLVAFSHATAIIEIADGARFFGITDNRLGDPDRHHASAKKG